MTFKKPKDFLGLTRKTLPYVFLPQERKIIFRIPKNIWNDEFHLPILFLHFVHKGHTGRFFFFLFVLILNCKVNLVSLAGEALRYFSAILYNSCFYSHKHLLMPEGKRTLIQIK